MSCTTCSSLSSFYSKLLLETRKFLRDIYKRLRVNEIEKHEVGCYSSYVIEEFIKASAFSSSSPCHFTSAPCSKSLRKVENFICCQIYMFTYHVKDFNKLARCRRYCASFRRRFYLQTTRQMEKLNFEELL